MSPVESFGSFAVPSIDLNVGKGKSMFIATCYIWERWCQWERSSFQIQLVGRLNFSSVSVETIRPPSCWYKNSLQLYPSYYSLCVVVEWSYTISSWYSDLSNLFANLSTINFIVVDTRHRHSFDFDIFLHCFSNCVDSNGNNYSVALRSVVISFRLLTMNSFVLYNTANPSASTTRPQPNSSPDWPGW